MAVILYIANEDYRNANFSWINELSLEIMSNNSNPVACRSIFYADIFNKPATLCNILCIINNCSSFFSVDVELV